MANIFKKGSSKEKGRRGPNHLVKEVRLNAFGFDNSKLKGKSPFSHVNTCTTHLNITGRGKDMFSGKNVLCEFGIRPLDVADLCKNSLPFRKERFEE